MAVSVLTSRHAPSEYDVPVSDTDAEAAANAALDEVVAGMGADVCIWSVNLAIDEIAADLDTEQAERERIRALLRRRFGLAE
jgi:hypothetical protein